MATKNIYDLPKRLSIKQAAEYHGVCERTIRRAIADGRLRAYRVGRRTIRIDRDSFLEFEKPMFAA